MLVLQQGPAETTVYMIAGYSVIFGVMLLYLVSLVIRRRRMAQRFGGFGGDGRIWRSIYLAGIVLF